MRFPLTMRAATLFNLAFLFHATGGDDEDKKVAKEYVTVEGVEKSQVLEVTTQGSDFSEEDFAGMDQIEHEYMLENGFSNETNFKDGVEVQGRRILPMVEEATPSQFPFFVLIIVTRSDGTTSRCGGTLISNTWVLTAASCVASGGSVTVYAGFPPNPTVRARRAIVLAPTSTATVTKTESFTSTITVPTTLSTTVQSTVTSVVLSTVTVPLTVTSTSYQATQIIYNTVRTYTTFEGMTVINFVTVPFIVTPTAIETARFTATVPGVTRTVTQTLTTTFSATATVVDPLLTTTVATISPTTVTQTATVTAFFTALPTPRPPPATPSSPGTVFVHPEYKRNYLTHNLALVRLQNPFPITGTVRPINLPTKKNLHAIKHLDGVSLTSMGFGSGNTSQLYYSQLRQISKSACEASTMHAFVSYPEHTGCLTPTISPVGFCHGEVGSPVVYNFPRKVSPTLLGIVSQHDPCPSGFPVAYTKIHHFLEWIESRIKRPAGYDN